MEMWQSGLLHQFRKLATPQGVPRFESVRFRQDNMDRFEKQLIARFRNKHKSVVDKYDRTGHKIQLLMTLDDFRTLFYPYKDDPRFYSDVAFDSEYLCLSRNDDLGDYVIGNVTISTMRENSAERGFRDYGVTWNQSDEALRNQRNAFKEIGHAQKEKNSQWGTCWIYSLTERTNKKIPLSELSDWEAKGWIKGRKMGF
jgi:hypothetical protein